LQINPTLENNGDPVTRYDVYVDGGSLASQVFTRNTRYDGSSSTFVVDIPNDSLTAGEKYRFVTTATNDQGESSYSQEVRAAVSDLPAKPAGLTRSTTLSTRTQLQINWAVEPDTQVPITGYILEWDNGEAEGTFVELWNGVGRPEVLLYTVTVTTGSKYSFRYKSINYNGQSVYSDVLETYACVSPSAPGTPSWVASTTTSIQLSWTTSIDDGGCPIFEYQLFRDAGDGSATATTQIHITDLANNNVSTS
jgi:hypothetical protein